MKKENYLKVVLAILVVVLISIISFIGIYTKNKNKMETIIKDYAFGGDLANKSVMNLSIKDDEDETTDETTTSESAENTTSEGTTEATDEATVALTADDYKKAKSILEKRLSIAEVSEYYIRLNEENGKMIVEVPEDIETTVLQNLAAKGAFAIEDANSNVLVNATGIKNVDVKQISTTYYGDLIQVDINLTDAAKNEISGKSETYLTEADSDGNLVDQEIQLSIDGTAIFSTKSSEFFDEASDGVLNLYMGQGAEAEELAEYYTEAMSMKMILESGELPATYTIDYSNTINSDISIQAIVITGCIALVILAIYLIIKYKPVKGIIALISLIGLIASLLVVLRYTNVTISLEGIFAIALITIIDYLLLIQLLNKKDIKKEFNTEMLKFIKIIVPCFILSIVFCFIKWLAIYSFGMVMFWGLVLIIVYNYLITKTLLLNIKNK